MSTNKNSYSNLIEGKAKFKDLVDFEKDLKTTFLRKEVNRIREIQDRKLLNKYFDTYDKSEVINNSE